MRILILTTFDLDEYVFAALQAGASGFLLRTPRRPTCSPAFGWWPPATRCSRPASPGTSSRRSSQRPADVPALDAGRLDVLTERERDVLALVAKGLSNAEIAARLYISPATVKTHVARTLTKLDARDRAQLIVIAYETRLVRPGET